MTGAYRTEGVVLVDGETTVDGRSRAIECFDWSDLWRPGPSRGFNRIVPGTPGTIRRDHVRGELDVTLAWRLHGAWKLDGTHQTAGARSRLLDHIDMLNSILDEADGRQLQITLYDDEGASVTRNVTYKATGRFRTRSAIIVEVDVLLAVPSGRVPRPEAGS